MYLLFLLSSFLAWLLGFVLTLSIHHPALDHDLLLNVTVEPSILLGLLVHYSPPIIAFIVEVITIVSVLLNCSGPCLPQLITLAVRLAVPHVPHRDELLLILVH